MQLVTFSCIKLPIAEKGGLYKQKEYKKYYLPFLIKTSISAPMHAFGMQIPL